MAWNYKYVKAWRLRLKGLLVAAFGGRCGACPYRRCAVAFDFHHLDPKKKDIGISNWLTVASYARLADEVEKCVMLCSNCHREVHAGARKLPKNIRRFNRRLFDKLRTEASAQRQADAQTRRSISTRARKRGDWSRVDIAALRRRGVSWSEIARRAGVSIAAVQKHHAKSTGA